MAVYVVRNEHQYFVNLDRKVCILAFGVMVTNTRQVRMGTWQWPDAEFPAAIRGLVVSS